MASAVRMSVSREMLTPWAFRRGWQLVGALSDEWWPRLERFFSSLDSSTLLWGSCPERLAFIAVFLCGPATGSFWHSASCG